MDLNFVRGMFTEAELEAAIIDLFQKQDYNYVLGETIHRRFEEILLKDDLCSYLSAHYPDLTTSETEKVIGRIENIPSAPLYQGNLETFLLVNEGFDLQRDNPADKGFLFVVYDPDRQISDDMQFASAFEGKRTDCFVRVYR